MKKLFLFLFTLTSFYTNQLFSIQNMDSFINDYYSENNIGMPRLTYAIHAGYREIALYFLSKEYDPNEMSFNNYTSALTEAVLKEDEEIVNILILNGADVNFISKVNTNINFIKKTPLSFAINSNINSTITEVLLKNGAEIDHENLPLTNNITRLIHIAIKNGDLNKYLLLCLYGAEKNILSGSLTSPISSFFYIANNEFYNKEVVKSKLIIAQDLLDSGVDINFLNYTQIPSIIYAMNNPIGEIIEFFTRNGAAKISENADKRFYPLVLAIRNMVYFEMKPQPTIQGEISYRDILILLINNGCDVNYNSEHNLLPYYCVKNSLYVNYLNEFNKYGSCLDIESTPCMISIIFGKYDIAEMLIKNGASLEHEIKPKYTNQNIKGKKYTPLILAILASDFEAVNFLLKHGADPENSGEYGEQPMFVANTLKSNVELEKIKELLRKSIKEKWSK